MARVWRPGQQKEVYLYRLLSTGTIEGELKVHTHTDARAHGAHSLTAFPEKVYQRQVSKKALSKSVVEGDVDSKPSFTTKELRDLFRCVCACLRVRVLTHFSRLRE